MATKDRGQGSADKRESYSEGPLVRVSEAFANVSLKYVPHPLIYTIALTVIAWVLAITLTPTSPLEAFSLWGEGVFSEPILVFTAQICIAFITGYAIVTSPPAQGLLERVAAAPRSPRQAVFMVVLVSMTLSYVHWAFGLIMSGLFAKEVASRVRDVHYPLLIAGAFSGYVIWHNGISGVAPQSVATPGSPTEDVLGIVPVSQTIFDPVNLIIVAFLFLTLPALLTFMHPKRGRALVASQSVLKESVEAEKRGGGVPASMPEARASGDDGGEASTDTTVAERLNYHWLLGVVIATFGVMFLARYFFLQGFALNLNIINLLFLTIGLLLIRRPVEYANSIAQGTSLVVPPVLLQFPLYGGILGLIANTGVAALIVEGLATIATSYTLPFFTFLSAGVLNLFLPSGGGQWIVQSSIVAGSTQELGSDPGLNVIGFAFGDAWTNMLQPYWALPMLALAGLEAKHIVGYTAIVAIFVGVVVSSGLLLLPMVA